MDLRLKKLLFFVILISPITYANNNSHCPNILKRIAKFTSISTSLAVVGYLFGPTFYYEMSDLLQEDEHIGYGIFLDMPKIISSLEPIERDLLKNPQKNKLKIFQLFTDKLSGDYDEIAGSKSSFEQWFPPKQFASNFFKGGSNKRGICKHKTQILGEILSRLGIEFKVGVYQDGNKLTALKQHAWIYIPSEDLVLDPTLGRVLPLKEYKRILVANGMSNDNAFYFRSINERWFSKGTWY